jgi:hypothetical protein
VKLSNVPFNPSEFHKKGLELMQNHQLHTLIQIKTTLKLLNFGTCSNNIETIQILEHALLNIIILDPGQFSFIFYKHWVE